MKEKCGDFGGRTQSGEPCGRKAGWGRPGSESGRCKDHVEVDTSSESETSQNSQGSSMREQNSFRNSLESSSSEENDITSLNSIDNALLEIIHHHYQPDKPFVRERQNWLIYVMLDSFYLGLNHSFDEFTDLWTEFVTKRDEIQSLRNLCDIMKKELTSTQNRFLVQFMSSLLLVNPFKKNPFPSIKRLSNSMKTGPVWRGENPEKTHSQFSNSQTKIQNESSQRSGHSEIHKALSSGDELSHNLLSTNGYVSELLISIHEELKNRKTNTTLPNQQEFHFYNACNLAEIIPPGLKASDELFKEANQKLESVIDKMARKHAREVGIRENQSKKSSLQIVKEGIQNGSYWINSKGNNFYQLTALLVLILFFLYWIMF